MSIQLLGKEIVVTDSKNISLVGLCGIVIQETKYSLLLKTVRGQKRIVKNTITFTLESVVVVGKTIMQTPQDRLKLKWKQK